MRKKYKHLSIMERYEIKELRDKQFSINKIAENLNRSKCTISMEVRRNRVDKKYMPCVAQKKYENRLHKEDGLRIEKNKRLLQYIKNAMIVKKWAPDAIAGRLKLENNGLKISHESIYRFIYSSPIARKIFLHTYLPSKRFIRQARGTRRTKIGIPQRVSIHDRDIVAGQKKEIGHFEADLTFHNCNRSMNIGAMVDKKTQKIMLSLNLCKKTVSVTAGFLRKIRTLQDRHKKTITMDNGKEFVGHIAYRLAGFKTFFCDPYRPKQKALVEKMNSMIHRILPKTLDITKVTQKTLNKVEKILNRMPRKIFGYKTPNEIWSENL
jgi:IS30 family transposase